MSVAAWRAGALSTGARTGPLQDWSGRTVRTMPAGSVEFLRVPIRSPHRPDAAPSVRLALTLRAAAPVEADWQSVTFQDGWARIFTTGLLPVGEFMLWVEITDHPQRVYSAAGLLTVTRGPGPGAPIPRPTDGGYLDAYFGTYLGNPDAGLIPVGPGPTPDPTPDTDSEAYIYEQTTLSSSWSIPNPLGRLCGVDVYVAGELVEADVFTTATTVSVTFPGPVVGTAVLN